MGEIRAEKGRNMATKAREWPENAKIFRDEAAEWISKAIKEQQEQQSEKALFSMMTALRWLEKAGAPTEPMSIETVKLFANFGK